MENDEIILHLINNYLKNEMYTKNIRDINFESPISNLYAYKNYTIEDFFVFYKIKKLYKLGIINNKIKTLLTEIYDIKLQLQRELGELLYRNLFKSEEDLENKEFYTITISELDKKIAVIDANLSKYHLLPSEFEFSNAIKTLIKNEHYDQNSNEEDLIKLIKSLK
ncbi:MAG: hypothetical protein IKN63_06395 [Bacilli bacterium]|nr:hypothetical protein [Bacilli bacterium]